MNRQESMKVSKGAKIRNRYNQVPRNINNKNDQQKKNHLETVSDNIFIVLLEGLN